MNKIDIEPHISRIEYGNGCIRVDLGHGIDVNKSKIRFVFNKSNAQEVTKVEAFIYQSCKNEFIESQKIDEDYLQEDFVELTINSIEIFDFCINKYQEMFSQDLKKEIQRVEEEIREIKENQKEADELSRKEYRENKEKAEKFDKLFRYIIKNQDLDNQIPLQISRERFSESDKLSILEEIYDILGIEVTDSISKRDLTVSKGDKLE